MFGLSFEKLFIIGIIAVFVLGPEKLPFYAAQLGRYVRVLRDMANNAKDRMKDEMGSDFDDVNWKNLDPRQYDPRRIIREALLDDSTAHPEDVIPSERHLPPTRHSGETMQKERVHDLASHTASSSPNGRAHTSVENAHIPYDSEAT